MRPLPARRWRMPRRRPSCGPPTMEPEPECSSPTDGAEARAPTFEATRPDGIADAALRVIRRRRVDQPISQFECTAHRVDGVHVQIPGSEPEQRHAIARGQHVAGFGGHQPGFAGAPRSFAQSLLHHRVHDPTLRDTARRGHRPLVDAACECDSITLRKMRIAQEQQASGGRRHPCRRHPSLTAN